MQHSIQILSKPLIPIHGQNVIHTCWTKLFPFVVQFLLNAELFFLISTFFFTSHKIPVNRHLTSHCQYSQSLLNKKKYLISKLDRLKSLVQIFLAINKFVYCSLRNLPPNPRFPHTLGYKNHSLFCVLYLEPVSIAPPSSWTSKEVDTRG
jgi:hypothetical protein